MRARKRIRKPGQKVFVGHVEDRQTNDQPVVEVFPKRAIAGRVRYQMIGTVAEKKSRTVQQRRRGEELMRQRHLDARIERDVLIVIEIEELVFWRCEIGE